VRRIRRGADRPSLTPENSMPSLVQYALRGSVAVITLDNPPVNALAQTQGLLQQIHDHLQTASNDPNVAAIVLRGAHRTFSGGADIKEFGRPRDARYMDLRDLVSYMDTVIKPMVAALHGPTMGGGTELALACHYRVAAPDTQIGLPEVKLGLLPGAGGTQRLPRLIGAEAALSMIVTGDPVGAAKAARLGIVDEVASGDPLEAAVAFAERAVREGLPLKRASAGQARVDGDPRAFFDAAREQTARASRGYPAPLQCLECVADAMLLPFEQGYANERARFMELVRSPESASLRHAFFAEREAAKIPDIGADVALIPIARATVIGAGTMGAGIAMNFANAGIPVTLLEAKAENLERGIATIRKNYANTVAKGRLSQEDMDRRMGLIVPAASYDDIRDADIVVEAVFEEMSVKQSVFRELDRVAKSGAILATNTSTLDVNQIADSTSRPESVIGTHFFSPANVMRLLEIVRGAKTAKPVVATTMALAKRLRKVGVLSGVCDGFIGNRMVEEYLRQAGYLVDEGALPQQVDGVLQRWGLAMGPFAMSDLAGLDIGWAIRKRRALERPAEKYSGVADRICELGRFGQKTGAGYYRYEPGSRTPIPDPVVEKLILDYAAERGIARRAISDDEIVERCIYALVNTGAQILDEGIALRASDIDVVYLTGYGLPAYRGGPMFYAETVGLARVLDTIRGFHARHGDAWKPAPLLERLVAAGHDTFQPV
jgi:3-hydroxyacyl-CoA dehydrogenase